MKIPKLRQGEIELRPFKFSDAGRLVELLNDRRVSRYVAVIPHPYSIAEAKAWLERTLPDYRKSVPGRIHFAIVYQGELVGDIGLHKISRGHMVEFGYWLGREYWRRGIMTAVLHMAEKYCRSNFGVIRFQAQTFTQNKPSEALLLKNGYQLEGKTRKSAMKDGKYHDHHIFGKVTLNVL